MTRQAVKATDGTVVLHLDRARHIEMLKYLFVSVLLDRVLAPQIRPADVEGWKEIDRWSMDIAFEEMQA